MPKTHPKLPLELYQVLEEEYLSLHGDLTRTETVRLRDRPNDIEARLDWQFHEGHVKDRTRLVNKLKAPTDADAAGRGDLAAHLRATAPEFARILDARAGALYVEDALNELLRWHIYSPDAFKYANLSDALRLLLATYSKAPDESRELAQVNRRLLEETFPDELEKLSDVRLAAMFNRLHRHEQGQAAVCLSGGGIRSGTFALGLLQGLARFGLLKHFDYLSTVSGGGYIGGWLTAWLHRHRNELEGVTEDMSTVEPRSKIDPDPPAIQYLREYSNFLTPKSGLLTADTWAFIAIYVRNMLLNWLVLFPLLLALLALPRLNVSLLLSHLGLTDPLGLGFPGRYLFLAAGSLLLTLAFTYIIISRPAVSAKVIERSGFWRGRRDQGHFLRWCLLPLLASAFCLTTYWLWSTEAHHGDTAGMLRRFLFFGVAVTLASWLAGSVSLGRLTHPNEIGWLGLAELIILVAVGAVGGSLLYYASASRGPWDAEWYACFAVPAMLTVILAATTLFVGLTSKGLFGWTELLNDEDREWWARFSAWVLISMLAWTAFNLLSIHGPRLLFRAPVWISSVGGLSAVASLLAGFSSKTPANEEQSASKDGMMKSFLRDQMMPLVALVFMLAFLVAMSLLVSFILYAAAPAVTSLFARTGGNWPSPTKGGYDLSVCPFGEQAHMDVIHYARLWFTSLFVVVTAGVGLVLANRINLNKFSLHAGYRNRLIRGFLGASRDRATRRPNPFTGFDPEDNVQMHELRPALFQEGDFANLESLADKINQAKDDTSKFIKAHLKKKDTLPELERYTPGTPLPQRLRMNLISDLNLILESQWVVPDAGAPGGLRLHDKGQTPPPHDDHTILEKRRALNAAYPGEIKLKYPPPHRLFHVINTSLNLVGGKKLAWQQRKAEPFAITPLHSGSFRVGYRRSRRYGGYRGISLGTAAAVSGAAASSNMGYYTTSPVLSLVLTLFNMRLGWWLGNPGPAGEDTYRREAPRVSLRPVVEEALGLTDDTNPYVYLTDGGHFENLGVYEMVLRRCRLIVVSDAAEDGEFKFNDLGNAVRKIRIDLGVPIEFDEVKIFKEKPKEKDPDPDKFTYWAFARIGYSDVDKVKGPGGDFVPAPDGVLIYVKPTVYGDGEPRDVFQYKKANEDFPHQSTGDQFFDEPQFESYRTLGFHIMNRICKNQFDQSGGKPAPSYDLNKAQFVRAAFENYPGNSNAIPSNKPDWLYKLRQKPDWLG